MFTVRAIVIFALPLLGQEVSQKGKAVNGLSRAMLVCVEKLNGPQPLADAVRDMAFAALHSTRRFTVSERCDKAEAIIKGSVIESVERLSRSEQEGIAFGAAAGAANSSGAAVRGVAGHNGESLSSSETRRNVSLSLRLVDADGIVLWAFTQESSGGKSKGPAADATERAIRQLTKDSIVSRPVEGQ